MTKFILIYYSETIILDIWAIKLCNLLVCQIWFIMYTLFFYKTVLYKNLKPHFDSSNWHEFQKVLMGILVGSNLKKIPDETHFWHKHSEKSELVAIRGIFLIFFLFHSKFYSISLSQSVLVSQSVSVSESIILSISVSQYQSIIQSVK